MDKDSIKDAFERVKIDMNSLRNELDFLKNAIVETRNQMIDICSILQNMHKNIEEIKKGEKTAYSTQNNQNTASPTHPSTDNMPFNPLKAKYLGISTGNGGVPTDRQTDRQTDTPAQNSTQKKPNVEDVTKILDSLDSIKKEIRLKFRRLTDQEMLIFSTIYQLEEEKGYSDYKTISEKIKLTESSVRDYVGRLIKKGIPIQKNKINNKTIHLTISDNLKKIASLSTIMQLRDL